MFNDNVKNLLLPTAYLVPTVIAVTQGTCVSIQNHFWMLENWELWLLLASSSQRPGMLLNILQYVEEPPS